MTVLVLLEVVITLRLLVSLWEGELDWPSVTELSQQRSRDPSPALAVPTRTLCLSRAEIYLYSHLG